MQVQHMLRQFTNRNNFMNPFSFFTKLMNFKKNLLLAAIVLPVVLLSCRGQTSEKPPVHLNMNMDDQERFEPQEKNEFFEDKRAMRQPVEGTISRGNLKDNSAYYQGINEDSSFVDEIPVDVTKAFLYRGQDRYNVYCQPCHGGTGDGEGIIMVNNYGFPPSPTFHQDRLREESDGYLYSVIANGIRTMPAYGHQVPVEDRWAIVAFIRALQRSQYVPEDEMENYDVNLAELREEFQKEQEAQQAREEAQASAAGDEEVTAERGKTIAQENACNACHTTDGSEMVGPTWQNLFGSERTLENGETVTADEDYIRESIVNPSAEVVEGFPPSMTPYDFLSESEIESLIEYIKSLSENQ